MVRFGIFEVDLEAFQVLRMLLERPGELVRREDLRQRLWPEVLFADFEPGLNKALHKVHLALGDSADNRRFGETQTVRDT